jgi:cytoskeletal protein RodZ
MVRLVAPIIAVVAVAAVVLVVFKINGHSSGNEPGPGVVTAATTPSVSPTITYRTAPPSTTPSPSTPSPSTPTQKHTVKPPPVKPKSNPDKTAMAPVRVYNSTTITGLAHHVASEVEARGWDVIDVGNVSGASSLTTLYYAPGLKAAAQHLASEFSGIRQVVAAQSADITFSGLTLILTADWDD